MQRKQYNSVVKIRYDIIEWIKKRKKKKFTTMSTITDNKKMNEWTNTCIFVVFQRKEENGYPDDLVFYVHFNIISIISR